MDQQQALSALSAMANATRLEIVRLLVPRGNEGLAAGDIATYLGISASALSFHLSALEQAGLIASKKCSRQVFYRADHPRLGAVIGYLLNDCCGAHPEVCTRSQTDAKAPNV
ncbi:MAG: helix-turn-helix transcriptional regulator [Rhodobacteraceae bacterium]|nr:helix-turn-helix transcriptional regulator [Paracoccaceae bacterium]